MDLRLRTKQENGVALVEVAGELEMHAAPELRAELQRVCATEDASPKPRVLIDLSQVSFIDSTGIGVLVGGLKRAREAGGALVLVCPVPRLRRVFEITGLLQALPLFQTRDEALQALDEAFKAPHVSHEAVSELRGFEENYVHFASSPR